LVNHHARDYIDPLVPFGFFDRLARILNYLPGDADQFAVFGQLLRLPLAGAHTLDLLHPAARAARAIGKALHALG
jgi:hypothetical protein